MSSSAPARWRVALRGTRARRSRMSRRARPSAKLSRKVPPEYITATTQAARASPTSSAEDMESAATISSPISPRRRLRRISSSSASSTGIVPTLHTRRRPAPIRRGARRAHLRAPQARGAAAGSSAGFPARDPCALPHDRRRSRCVQHPATGPCGDVRRREEHYDRPARRRKGDVPAHRSERRVAGRPRIARARAGRMAPVRRRWSPTLARDGPA